MLSDRFCCFKRLWSGLILFVGRMFCWFMNMKVVGCIYDVVVIYLSVILEYIVEEFVFRVVNSLGNFCYLLINYVNYSYEYIVLMIIVFIYGCFWW